MYAYYSTRVCLHTILMTLVKSIVITVEHLIDISDEKKRERGKGEARLTTLREPFSFSIFVV